MQIFQALRPAACEKQREWASAGWTDEEVFNRTGVGVHFLIDAFVD